MENILREIDDLQIHLKSLLPMSNEDKARLDKKIRLEYNYNSNHIEGNTLTYGETELLLYFENTIGDHSFREYEEMKAHDVAFRLIQQWAQDSRPLTEIDIQNLHKILLVRPYWKPAITPDGQSTRREILVGEYKKYPNSVRLPNGEMFEYASPLETPVKMGELIDYYRESTEKNSLHPVVLAADMHYRFVRIHPFDDGNGRISRLLMNYILFCYQLPPVIIKSADKANYLRALNRADVGDMNAFFKYIGEQMIWSLNLSISAAKGESIEESDDLDKELAVLQRQFAKQEPIAKKADQKDINEAVSKNILPIIDLIDTKLAIIKGLFVESGQQIQLLFIKKTDRSMLSYTLEIGHKLNVNIITNYSLQNECILKSIYVSFSLNGLKSTLEAPSFNFQLNIEFNDYNYKMDKKLFAYDQTLTEVQRSELIKPYVKELIRQIQSVSGSIEG